MLPTFANLIVLPNTVGQTTISNIQIELLHFFHETIFKNS